MTFNFFLKCFPPPPPPVAKCNGISSGWRAFSAMIIALGLLGGCQTAPPLPPVDLHAPGWEIHQGQALWKPQRDAEGIAGELLIATQKDRLDRRALIQFSKNPFPIVSAGIGPHSWELAIPTQGKHYSHRGNPPHRVIWFHLPDAVTAQDPPKPWLWTPADAKGNWRLENRTSGESLEGYFSQ